MCTTALAHSSFAILMGNGLGLFISCNHMKALHSVAFILLVIGGLNWLLVGLFDWGVADILGMSISKLIYILVGVSAIYLVATHKKDCRMCPSGASTPSGSAM